MFLVYFNCNLISHDGYFLEHTRRFELAQHCVCLLDAGKVAHTAQPAGGYEIGIDLCIMEVLLHSACHRLCLVARTTGVVAGIDLRTIALTLQFFLGASLDSSATC